MHANTRGKPLKYKFPRFGIFWNWQIFGSLFLIENCACTCRGDDAAEHHKKDITTNTTNRRTPQTPQDPRKIRPDLTRRRRLLLHGPGAATRRRGGTSGSNRGPATTSWASRAVAEIRQRHRGPVRLHKNLTKASGTGEIAQPGEHHSQESSRFLSVNSRFP